MRKRKDLLGDTASKEVPPEYSGYKAALPEAGDIQVGRPRVAFLLLLCIPMLCCALRAPQCLLPLEGILLLH